MKSKHDWLTFAILALLVLSTRSVLSPPVQANEAEQVAIARHFVNPDFIPNDWYLNQPIGYRYLFNGITGVLVNVFPVWIGVVIMRTILHLGYAFAFFRLAKVLKVNVLFAALAILLFLSDQSLLADESLVTGLETKAFSYVMLLLSLSYLLEKRYPLMWGTLGLALSFHILVGGYATLTTVGVLGIRAVRSRMSDSLKDSARGVWLYPIGGILGFWAAISYVLGASTVDSEFAARIYAGWRNWHHTHVMIRSHGFSEMNLLRILSAIGTIWIAWFVIPKSEQWRRLKQFLFYGAIASVFLAVGAVASTLRLYDILKFYLFRFPDVMVHFVLSLGTASVLAYVVRENAWLRHRSVVTNVAAGALCIIVAIPIGQGILRNADWAGMIGSDPRGGIPISNPAEKAFYDWIAENTPEDAVFLTPPFGNQQFYLKAGRAQFVSFNAVSSTDPYILEWYERMTFVNGGKQPDMSLLPPDSERAIMSRYRTLSTERLQGIPNGWRADYYAVDVARPELDMPKVFGNDFARMYRLTD
jgi:hypothetical protein